MKYSRNNGLRLDGVYHIVKKKTKKMLTVNYNLIESDFNIKTTKIGSPLLTSSK